MTTFDPRELRNAFSSFATGVTVITTQDAENNPLGMTASSFNSVSVDPPLILWSITKTAYSAKAFTESGHFCVNVLGADQVSISNQFARSGADKFSGVSYSEGLGGCRKLSGAICHMECSTWATYDGGDHTIIVGKVEQFEVAEGNSLVFAQGSYARAEPLIPNVADSNQSESSAAVEGLLLYHVSRAQKKLADSLTSAIKDANLTRSSWRILANLVDCEYMYTENLTDRIFSGIREAREGIDTLVSQGLATISGKKISATNSGRERAEHLFAIARKAESAALGEFSTDERSKLISQLSLLK